jgi:hypothetical protein
MKVDSSNVIADGARGRKSVRIESKMRFTHGLLVVDVSHMPGGQCGTWPAFWTYGDNWPQNGEIDIIEGVNSNTNNLMAAHTSPGCTINGQNQLGTFQSEDCDTTVNYNSGCGTTADPIVNTYGASSNANGGSVYAMQWTSDYIRIWHFPRSAVPDDLTSGKPDPSTWGLPLSNFAGNCEIDDKFRDHKIVFDTTFCGDWAGSVWVTDSVCKNKAPTCVDYVKNNPAAFADAYWEVNSVKLFKLSNASPDEPVTFSPTGGLSITPISSTVQPQSSVLAPGMGGSTDIDYSSILPTLTAPQNGTSAPTSSAPSITPSAPANVGEFEFLGCAGSPDAFSAFTQVANSPEMDIATCTTACQTAETPYAYAGIFNSLCFCSNTLGASTELVSAGRCNNPCPGNPMQLCGGNAQPELKRGLSDFAKRQASNLILLSVYVNPALVDDAGLTTAAPTAPASQTFGYGLGGGAKVVVDVTISVVYNEVCTVCAGGVTTVTSLAAVPSCGCHANAVGIDQQAVLAPPMVVVTEPCVGCEGVENDEVVVTVLAQNDNAGGAQLTGAVFAQVTGAVVAEAGNATMPLSFQPTRTGGPVMFTGAAARVGVAEAALAVAAGVFALL